MHWKGRQMVKEWVLKLLIHLSVGGGQAPIGGCHRWQAVATSTGASPPHPQTLLLSKFYSLQCLALPSDMFHTLDLLRVQWHRVIESTQSGFYSISATIFTIFTMVANQYRCSLNSHTSCSSFNNHHMTERNLVPMTSSLCSGGG